MMLTRSQDTEIKELSGRQMQMTAMEDTGPAAIEDRDRALFH